MTTMLLELEVDELFLTQNAPEEDGPEGCAIERPSGGRWPGVEACVHGAARCVGVSEHHDHNKAYGQQEFRGEYPKTFYRYLP